MSGMALFGRVVTLTVGDREFSDLRVSFDIQRTSRSKPNPAKIVIYNLSKSTREAISERLTPVRLVAGYGGQAGQIFSGQLDSAEHGKAGATIVSTIHASDGRGAWQSYATAKGWRGGTPWAEVVRELATSMGLEVGPASLAQVTGSARGTYAVQGYAWREMDLLIATLGLQWSIQDGALQVVQADKTTQESVVLLTPDSGLVGVPRFTDPKISRVGRNRTRRVRSAVEVNALLQPEFKPGRYIRIESQTMTGDYRLDSVHHKGDSHQGPLISTLACSAVNTGEA